MGFGVNNPKSRYMLAVVWPKQQYNREKGFYLDQTMEVK